MDQTEALNQIKYIKETMEKAGHSFFFSPWQWIEWGLLVTLSCIAMLLIDLDATTIKLLWSGVFVVGGTLETWIWLKGAKSHGIDPLTPYFIKIWGILGLFLLLAVVLSFIFLSANLAIYIPGLWLIVTGSCMLSISFFGWRKELLVFGIMIYIAGLLGLSLLVNYSIIITLIFFGINGTLLGIYQLFTIHKL